MSTANRDRISLARELFQAGHYARISPLLSLLARERLSDPERCECAELAYRAGLYSLATQFLESVVYPTLRKTRKQGGNAKPTPQALALYAAALGALGAHSESNRLFAQADFSDYPEGWYLRGLAALGVWDYATAGAALRRYLDGERSPEERLAAELRLAICELRAEKKDPEHAKRLLTPYAAGKIGKRADQMYAQQIEIERIYFFEKNEKEALRIAEGLEFSNPDHHSVGITLWYLLLSIRTGGASAKAHERFQFEKARCWSEQNYYGFRLFDLYRSFLLKDRDAFLRFQFGTPFEGMRRVARERFEGNASLPEHFVWSPQNRLSEKGVKAGPVLDLFRGELRHQLSTTSVLKPGSLLLVLLRSLASDFYRPLGEFELHEALYPGEVHHWGESTQRIHTLFHRLREELKAHRLDATIEAGEREYILSSSSTLKFELKILGLGTEGSAEEKIGPELQIALEKLQQTFGAERFTSGQVTSLFEVSARTANYRLKELLAAGKVVAEGKGPARKYRLAGV